MDISHQHTALPVERRKRVRRVAEDARSLLAVGNAIDADVHNGGSGPDEVGGKGRWTTERGYQKIALTADSREVPGLGMANGDGSVLMQQQQSHGLTNDVAAAHHHGVAASHRHLIITQHPDNAGGRAGSWAGPAGGQCADVAGMEAVNIFFRRDGEQRLFAVYLLRERHLHEDAVDFRAAIQLTYDGQ